MIQKKICMLGAFAVGKTSLVKHYVHSIFSEKYLTTIGVKIDKKTIEIGDRKINLLLWDIQGEDEFQKVRMSYLRGASGCLLVADGTRGETLETAKELKERADESVGTIPFVLAVNKADLRDEWDISDEELEALAENGWDILKTSAKSGEGVNEAFQILTKKILEK